MSHTDATIAIYLDDFYRVRQMKGTSLWTLERSRWNYVQGAIEYVDIATAEDPLALAATYIGIAAGKNFDRKPPEQMREFIRQMNTEFTRKVSEHIHEEQQKLLNGGG